MVKKLAIDWDDHELRYITAQCSGRSVKIVDVKVIDIHDRTPEEVLATEFQTAGLSEAETLVTIGRGKAELRELQLPPVPTDELPDMVRFQSLRSFASISDSSVVDYLVTKQLDAGIEVIAAAVAHSNLESIRGGIEKASLSLKRIGLRPLAAAALHLTRQPQAQPGEVVLIDLLPDNAEIVVARDGNVVFVRTVRMPRSEMARAKALAGELKRSLLACGVTDQLNRILLWGTEEAHRAEIQVLAETAGCEVQVLNPFDYVEINRNLQLPKHVGRLAPLLGLLVADEMASERLIDFMNPRKPEIKTVSPYRKMMIVGVPIAACALLALVVYQKLASLDQQIAQLRDSNASMQANVKLADESIAKIETVDAFLDGDVNWLQEIRRMAIEMPASEQMIIRGVSASVNARRGGGVLKIEGGAVNPAVIDEFEKALRDENHQVNGTGASERKSEDDYRWEFSESISVASNSIRDARYYATNSLLSGSDIPITDEESTSESGQRAGDEADGQSEDLGKDAKAANLSVSKGQPSAIQSEASVESENDEAEAIQSDTEPSEESNQDPSSVDDPFGSEDSTSPQRSEGEPAEKSKEVGSEDLKLESEESEDSSLETKAPEAKKSLEVAKVDAESQR